MQRKLTETYTTAAATAWRNWLCFTFIACLALSAYKVHRTSTVNNDGLLYLSTAQAFVEHGAKAAFEQFNWPAFPILIGLAHQAFGIGYESAAYGVNALLLALLSIGFLLLYRETTGGQGRPWLAAAVILASPQITDYRAFIIRDIGYWALALWAVLCFARYCRRQRWRDALAWQACIAGAIAFRIEGAALAALLPLHCFLQGEKRGMAWLRANSLFLLGAAVVAFLLLLATGAVPLPSSARLEQLQHYLSLPRIGAQFAAKADAVARHAQTFYAPQDIGPLLFGGVLSLFLYKTLSCLGLGYAPLLLWALWRRRARLFEQRVVWYAAGITAIPLLAFAFNDLFLSARYMGLLIVLLSLPVTKAAELLLFENGPVLVRPRWAAALALAVAAMLLDAFIQTGPSKRYLREAGDWAHDHLPASLTLCSDDATLMYYAGREAAGPCPALERIRQPDGQAIGAFLIKVGRKDSVKRERLQSLLRSRSDLVVAAQFANESGDSLYIVTAARSAP